MQYLLWEADIYAFMTQDVTFQIFTRYQKAWAMVSAVG